MEVLALWLAFTSLSLADKYSLLAFFNAALNAALILSLAELNLVVAFFSDSLASVLMLLNSFAAWLSLLLALVLRLVKFALLPVAASLI